MLSPRKDTVTLLKFCRPKISVAAANTMMIVR